MRRPCYLHPHHRTTWAAAPPCPRLTRRGRSSRRRGAGRGRPPPRPEHSLRHGTGSGTPLDCPRRTSSITRGTAALHRIIIVRMRMDDRTKTYVERRTAEGKTKLEIIRCLKRHLIREVWKNTRDLRLTQADAALAA